MPFEKTFDKKKVFKCPHCGTTHPSTVWEVIEWWGTRVVRCNFCFQNTEVK